MKTPSEKPPSVDKLTGMGSGQIRRVWESYLGGSRTTYEVSVDTGLSVKYASAYTRELIQRGFMRCGGVASNQEGHSGQKSFWYEPITAASETGRYK